MQTFGHYVAFQHLASGGMAELFLARDQRFGLAAHQRLYVVKQLAPRLAADSSFANMFVDEVRVARRLRHPNIVRVFDTGYTDDGLFYTMEYLNGRDLVALRRRVWERRTRLPMAAAISISIQVCRALAYAHDLRDVDGAPMHVVHRDVSPGNVIVTVDGVAKLLDFGIAHAANRLETTKTGILKGKLRHMSPEQAFGLAIDRRSDVFSVSVLLWELTVGRTLYDQDGDLGVLRAIADADAPRPSSVRAGYPPELEHIVCTGLQRTREHRYQNADALANALEAYADRAGLDVSSDALAVTVGQLFDDSVPALTLDAPAPSAEPPSYVEARFESEPIETTGRRRPLYLLAALLYAFCVLGLLIAVAMSS